MVFNPLVIGGNMGPIGREFYNVAEENKIYK